MNNVWLILEREYLERVKKRSFLIATLLTPLIFPVIIAISVVLTKSDSNTDKIVYMVDESGLFTDVFEGSDVNITVTDKSIDSAKVDLATDKVYGILHIPDIDKNNPRGISYYSKSSPGLSYLSDFKGPIRSRIEDMKIEELNLDKEILDQIKVSFDIATFNVTDSGESKKSSTAIASGMGYFAAFLIYIFVFVYGSFIMQSVLNEKTNKIVEVIVSSVKPFQLMLGKVLGVGAVAITQFAIWIILITSLTVFASTYFGYNPGAEQQEMMQQTIQETGENPPEFVTNILDVIYTLPLGQIIFMFLVYFLGGFLLYGALFAAVGSAVDSLQEAQQFTLPISLPIIASIVLMTVVLNNPDGAASVALTMIPFTSPVLMMARVPFGVPVWQIAVSILLLIAGVVFALWLAGRIYRIGILTTGSKVTYKTLGKWLTMKY